MLHLSYLRMYLWTHFKLSKLSNFFLLSLFKIQFNDYKRAWLTKGYPSRCTIAFKRYEIRFHFSLGWLRESDLNSNSTSGPHGLKVGYSGPHEDKTWTSLQVKTASRPWQKLLTTWFRSNKADSTAASFISFGFGVWPKSPIPIPNAFSCISYFCQWSRYS